MLEDRKDMRSNTDKKCDLQIMVPKMYKLSEMERRPRQTLPTQELVNRAQIYTERHLTFQCDTI